MEIIADRAEHGRVGHMLAAVLPAGATGPSLLGEVVAEDDECVLGPHTENEDNDGMVDMRAQADVASVVVTAHGAVTSVRAQAGVAFGALTADTVVRATVHAVVDAIHPTGATTTDLQALAALLNEAIRTASPAEQVVKEIEQQVPLFGSFGRFLHANQGLINLIALVVMVMAYQQDRANNAHVDPPPSVTVKVEPPDRAEVERIVEEKLRGQHVPVEAPATEAPERELRIGSCGPQRNAGRSRPNACER